MKISKEGNSVIPVAFGVLAALAVGFIFLTRRILAPWPELDGPWVIALWGLAALVTWCFVVAFFRIPNRPLSADDEMIFSPCDGRVVVAEDVTENEVTGEVRIQVSVFMSITNIHQNWFPVGGRVTYFRHHHGRFMVAWHPKSSDDNEHTTTAVETPAHGTMIFRQVAGMVARRIVSYAVVGETAVQNTPCGFIKFGSRVDLFLPPDAEVLVGLGQKVRGGQTPIAKFGAGRESFRPVKISGLVVEGSKVGRELGYPTANVAVPDSFPAASGVYAARVDLDGRCHGAMANLGVKPTFPGSVGGRILELHLFGFGDDLYGRELNVELVEFIRAERKFAGPEALRAQIEIDEKIAKRIVKCI